MSGGGKGAWDDTTYDVDKAAKIATYGTTFVHTADVRAGKAPGLHPDMDPKRTNNKGDHAGTIVRECLDTDDQPETTPIALVFDETGSMGLVPGIFVEKLRNLFGLLRRKGYVEFPQILIAAVGDCYSDGAPLQVGQFESDNRIDDQLSKIYIEGNGGGQNQESYNIAAHFLAEHCHLDSLIKRGRKGYCFIMGDERNYKRLDRAHIKQHIGTDVERSPDTTEIFARLQESFETFFLFVGKGSQYSRNPEGILAEPSPLGYTGVGWRHLLGERAIVMDDPANVCEIIALTIGMLEGAIDLDTGLSHLDDVGSAAAKASVSTALAAVKPGTAKASVVVQTGSGVSVAGTGSERL